MEARNKRIEDWFAMIKQGLIALPRFQRHEAWKPTQVVGLLQNIVREPSLPVGALLTLEVGEQELFVSRPIVGAPEGQSKPSMHLLDGQQRLTALWRSLTNNYPDMDLFVSVAETADPSEDDDGDDIDTADAPMVEVVKRWDRKGIRQPVWADNPVEALQERSLVPVAILCPGSDGEAALNKWEDAVEHSGLLTRKLTRRIEQLRQRVAKYDIPFLSLGAKTSRGTALDVFIKMNTSASPLRDFDIVVAQIESVAGQSLHEMVKDLIDEVPIAKDFGKIEDLILSISALLMDKPPLRRTYLGKDFVEGFTPVWPRLKRGLRCGLDFLRSEAIFNEKNLPTEVAVYLSCALWADVPENGFDKGGNARTLIRKALWRACYTERYSKNSSTRAHADYRSLKRMIGGELGAVSELFDEALYPLPTCEQLVLAGWPGGNDRLPRAILATALRRGGSDFADGATISAANYHSRELHHLFPVQFLGGGRKDERVNRALNCALVSWTTNRRVGAKSPAEYIKDRSSAATLGEAEIRSRLETHLIPHDAILLGDYEEFLEARAKWLERDMKILCEGAGP